MKNPEHDYDGSRNDDESCVVYPTPERPRSESEQDEYERHPKYEKQRIANQIGLNSHPSRSARFGLNSRSDTSKMGNIHGQQRQNAQLLSYSTSLRLSLPELVYTLIISFYEMIMCLVTKNEKTLDGMEPTKVWISLLIKLPA
ncbi:hypothetical protein [Paenibacillus sp. R14(2021)]|uniref:hypothetical protein n=1 Tax=Paenibacillus sp. R14(2021) TaxID=2859228 RepID=UPI001C6123B3|nr:hypothetical protein [Paenibacillus sp. R14(2021)]